MQRVQTLIAGFVLVALILVAYSATLNAPFEFDDQAAIVNNGTLRNFWEFNWLSPTAGGDSTVSGRPVLAATLAANYAIGGLDVRGYHILNITIHVVAALLLFGLLRRAIAYIDVDKSRATHDIAAFAAAGIWALHPLQTEAVTYIVQRAESLMALFYLLTLYCFLRGLESTRRTLWWTGSTLCCAAGMGTKEVMVSAPVMILLFDRAYIEQSFSAAWKARKTFYTILAATWLPLLFLVWSLGGNRGGSTGGLTTAGAVPYWLSQCIAIPTYIKLILWPNPLVFEYGPDVYNGVPELIVCTIVTLALIALCFYAWFKRPRLGFLGLYFLAILAPTSLVPGTLQAIVEHRLYLAIAPVSALVSFYLYKTVGLRSLIVLVPILVALGFLTFKRNEVYRTATLLWEDTVIKRPENARAHHNYAEALVAEGRVDEAITQYRRAISIQPNHAFAHEGLGRALLNRGDVPNAAMEFRAAIQADPTMSVAHVDLGRALTRLGQIDEAMQQYRDVLIKEPDALDARVNLGALLITQGAAKEGISLLRSVLSIKPNLAEAHYHLGLGLEKLGDSAAARDEYAKAIQLKSDFVPALVAFGNTAARNGDDVRAIEAYNEAIRLDPKSATAQYGLGNIFARSHEFARAIDRYAEALRLDPTYLEARNNLANCQLVSGDFSHAIENYRRVLQQRPGDQTVEKNLVLAEEMARQGTASPALH